MKNLKLIPFVLIIIYFLTMRIFPEMTIEIKLIFAAVIVLISTLIMFKLIKAGTIKKQSFYIFGGFVIVSLAITLYFFQLKN